MEKTHLLITLAFDNSTAENINVEFAIKKEIANVLARYKKEDKISHFIIADNEVISDTLKRNVG